MISANVNCPKCGFSFPVQVEGPGADIDIRCPKCGSAVFGTAHESRKVIGVKTKYGITEVFVFQKPEP